MMRSRQHLTVLSPGSAEVTAATVPLVPTARRTDLSWTVLAVRLPAEPSRHRVAVWRELRRVGALSLGQGVWALPKSPAFEQGLERALGLIDRGNGEAVILQARGRDQTQAARLEELFTAGREEEWAEFISECGKYEAELDRELADEKFTLAELDEEEQSLERLRRWYRELKLRDLFGAPSAARADQLLKRCQTRLEAFAERVYAALHGH
jgi:ChrB-like protein